MSTARILYALPCLLLLVFACPALAGNGLRTAEQRDLRTRFYPDENVRHVMEEATKIFELAQAGYNIIYGKRGVIASRQWGWETIIDETVDLGVGGAAYWYVDLTQEDNGVTVRIRCVPEPDPHTPLDPAKHEHRPGNLVSPATIQKTTPQPQEDQNSAALYAVFFNRMDVLVGQNRFWLYCRAAEEFVKMEQLSGSLDGLCLEAGDLRPGAKLP